MLKRKNSLSLLVSKLDTRLIDKFLSLNISKEDLKKFDEQEKKEMIAELTDLKNLRNQSESEIYKTLDCMFSNNQFFMYCGPLLLNINPGPNHVNDYLNLANWMQQNSGIPYTKWKPHLYSMMNSVYHSLIKDRKDQVVTFVGQVGSGKTFNLVHSLEFFCFFHSQEGMQMEFFETMHKSMQLMHIMGSIFRENNIESSSCGILMKMGFDDNFKICNFDIDAKIVDFTLPFSENGRSFSILHALVTGASPEIKRILDLPDREINLNFFRKFHQNFNQNTKERFKLNDYEIWTRFHSLLNFFDFSKNEVIEVLQLMAFILLCNEAAIGKKRTSQGDEYVINKSVGSKKLSKNLNINEEDFLKRFGSFKNIAEMKNTLISLMKFAYYAVFEYIKAKVKTFLANYFEKYRPNSQNNNNVNNNNNTTNNNINKNNSNTNLNDKNNNNNNNFNNSKAGDQSFYQTNPPVRNIFFIDTPGEVKDQTLGGLFTNLTNECLNLFTGTEYMSVVDKINQEKVDLKNFTPIHSFYAVEALIGKEGLANFLSQNFTEKNFKKLKSKIARKEYFYKTMKFIENLSHDTSVDFTFEFKFSNKNIFYNYESLYMETKSLMMNAKILSIFEASRNTIVKSQMKFLNDTPKNFYTYSVNTLAELFKPIEGLTPYIVYCLHSNNSLKSFFGNEPKLNLVEIDERNPSGNNYFSSNGIYVINKNQFIPNLETAELVKNSLIFPIVYWEWFGFHEWIEIEVFLKEFRKDFESVKEKIFKNRFKNLRKKTPDCLEDVDLKTLTAIEVVSYILNVLCMPKQYVIGEQHILLKKGILKKIREIVNNMVNMNAAEKTNLMSYGPDGKLMRRSSIDRSKGTPYRRMSSGRSGSIAGLKSQNTVNSRSNLGETNKFSRQNSIGRKGSKAQFGTVNNDEENVRIEGDFDSKAAGAGEGKGSYYKAHCSLKVFRESTEKILSPGLLGDNNELNINYNTNSKLNLNNNNNNNSRGNLNKLNNYNTNKQSNLGSKSNLSSLLNYNLNNANIQLLEDTDINNFITYSNKYNLYNYISFNKKLEISSINENSADQIHTTNLESEFDMYKRDENVVVPKPRQFNYIKNLFDYTKIDGFHIYDYNEFLPFIRMIQTNWRCYKSRKVYKIFRLVCRKIVMIQKWIRAWITKKKYKKFSYANKCIVFIQRMYKRRFFKLSQAATLFQSHFRRKKAFKRYLDKLAKKDLGEEDSEEEVLITKNANPHLHGNEALNREGKSMLKKELQSVSMSKYEKRKSIDQSSLIRRNQLNMSLLAEMEVDTDKRKILDILMNNSSVFKGIANKDVKQLDNDLELFKKNIAGKTGFKKTNLAGRNVQERLIEYGEMVKFKQTEKKMEQLKKAEEGLSFKPLTNTNSNVDLNRHGGKTIQERTEYRMLLKEKKLEAIRNKYQQDESELTFKPEINYKSKNIKRSVNDLMKWKEHKESVMEREKKFKEAAEMEEIRKNLQGTKINKVSEIIVKNKENSILLKKQENENKEMEEDFDLWPEINKAYVKDEDEAVDRPMLSEDLDHNEVLDLHI